MKLGFFLFFLKKSQLIKLIKVVMGSRANFDYPFKCHHLQHTDFFFLILILWVVHFIDYLCSIIL